MVTSPEQRSGLLVAVVSGGRPKLAERPTARILPTLRGFGMNDIVWVVNERDAGEYERDDHPMCVYPKEWSLAYAQKHWMLASPPNPGFLGAFPGREWACLEAERRGCWGVLQLDDNITTLTFPRGNSKSCREIVNRNGGLAMFADILSAVALSTNGRMVGANLGAMPSIKLGIARPGFPYSCFIEKVGSGRESWYGPYEDDITHAFQYGTRADAGSSTALVVPLHGTKRSQNQSPRCAHTTTTLGRSRSRRSSRSRRISSLNRGIPTEWVRRASIIRCDPTRSVTSSLSRTAQCSGR